MSVYGLFVWNGFIMHDFMNVDKTVSMLLTFKWTLLLLWYIVK